MAARSIDQVNQKLLDQVDEFFISYNKSRGKKFTVKGRRGPKQAVRVLEQGMRDFDSKNKARKKGK